MPQSGSSAAWLDAAAHPVYEALLCDYSTHCSPRNPKPYLNSPEPTFCRVPVNSIIGFIIGTYKKVGFGRFR